jgi:hypothetical protein
VFAFVKNCEENIIISSCYDRFFIGQWWYLVTHEKDAKKHLHLLWVLLLVMTFLVRECYGSPKKHQNSLKFVKIRAEECFDKVLNEEF